MRLLQKSLWAIAVVLALVAVALLLLSLERSHPKVSPERFKSTKTATLVMTVALAIRDFEKEYGRLPLVTTPPDQLEQGNADLVKILCADPNFALAHALNPKDIRFLADFFYNNNSDLLDAWGRKVHVMLAGEADSSVKVGSKIIPGSFAVWSDGANGENEYGDGDDIASWKVKRK